MHPAVKALTIATPMSLLALTATTVAAGMQPTVIPVLWAVWAMLAVTTLAVAVADRRQRA
ncbi:hypothetical protein ACFXAZ_15800 [Streptomyces sp. NPDC059477]|uniref:hypothetical protein n=1 Tax=Streptomyces sp. NPDC059477 TaxID=3346847 RepID=UPI003682D637